ncbi:hypothetical protein LPJ66_004449 [Kickxella alabastrina]|uniref:Uncharacterized protein n=1 Tax=Kickxella alabastrina TaxID=61397 RepID=A0ACC1IL38_9FUNG|nr:hypothetical protein LPJ66_004449 [Kickxella alabastrina]
MFNNSHLKHLAEIKTQEIELGTLDLAMFGTVMGDIYLYKNGRNDPDFMPFDAVAHSFCMLVANYYPILVGRPTVNSVGKGVMAVDPSNLCLPDIAEVFIDHRAESFFEARPNDSKDKPDTLFFNVHKFYRGSGVVHLPQATYHRDHSAAFVRILRFKNNSYVGISLSVSHGLFDGTSYLAFINHWAEYARNLDDVKNGTYQLAKPPNGDRQVMINCLDKVEPLAPPFIEHFRNIVSPLPMNFSTNIASVLMSLPDIQPIKDQHVLHFTPANLERMRHYIDEEQTINVTLIALLAKSMLQANIKAFGEEQQISYVAMAYDGRTRSTIPRNFSGNASCPTIAPLSPQMLLNSSYKDLSRIITRYGSKTESGHMKSTILMIENELNVLHQIGISLCNTPESSYIGMTNLRYMPYYSVDFGFGGPIFLGLDYFQTDGMSRLLLNKQDGGLDLYLNYSDAHFEVFRQLDDIKMFADIIY